MTVFKRFICCVRSQPPEEKPPPPPPVIPESRLYRKDVSGEIRIMDEFWDMCQQNENTSKSISDPVFSEDLTDASQEAWLHIREYVWTDESSQNMLKDAIGYFLDESTVETFLQLGEVIPWFGPFAKMGSIIYLGVQEVYTNLENCKKLAEYIKSIMVTFSSAPQDKLQLFNQAAQNVEKSITAGFEKYMSLAITLISRFTKRSNLMAFLMHSQDAQAFDQVQSGLLETMSLINFQMNMMEPRYINEYNKTRLEVENLVIKLGDGDVNRGLNMLSHYLKHPSNGNTQDNNVGFIFMQIKNVLGQLPETAQPQVDISDKEQLELNKLSNTKLPLKLSLQLKTFWWNKFGNEEQVEWSLFKREIEDSYHTFINSKEVQKKEDAENLGSEGFLKYVLKNMLDENQNGQISGAELRLLYEWCIKQWQYEEVLEGGYPPRTLADILRTLLRHMDKALEEIDRRQTLDLRERQISAVGVEQIVIQNNIDKLPLIWSLDVSRNPMGDRGARAIFKHAAQMPKLTCINFEDCRLGDALEGIQNLIPQLTKISLGKNQIGDRGVGYIVTGLMAGPVQIKELDLHENKISDVGVQQIIRALQTDDCEIEELFLNGNVDISGPVEEELKQLAETINMEIFF